AQAVLGVVLEQGVDPGGTMAAVLVDGVGRDGRGAAPDGGAAGGVGDVHLLTEQLGDQTCVRSLGAAGAGARELQQGLVEQRADDGVVRKLAEIGRASCRERVEISGVGGVVKEKRRTHVERRWRECNSTM